MKKIALFIVFVMVVSIFAGCGGQTMPTSEQFSNQLPQGQIQQMVYKPAEPVATDAPIVETEPETEPETKPVEPVEEDPIGIYRCTDENKDGIFLKRGDKYYFTDSKIRKQSGIEYTVGIIDEKYVTWVQSAREYVVDNRKLKEFVYDNVPIVDLQPGDIFVVFSSEAPQQLRISQVIDMNYTVTGLGDGFNVADSSGKIVPSEEWYSLKEGEVYTISWYEGTRYHEEKKLADKKCVAVPCYYDESILVDAELTKNGYGIYKIPSLEPGLYLFNMMLVRVG